jgi:hypothetical protein
MELQTPNLITPAQGLSFLAGLAAERNRQAENQVKNMIAIQNANNRVTAMSEHYDQLAQRYQWEHEDRDAKINAAYDKGKGVHDGIVSLQKDVAKIKSQKGTIDFDQDLNLVADDPKYYDVSGTPEFQRELARFRNESKLTAQGIANNKKKIISDFDGTLKGFGLNENAINYDLKYWRKQDDGKYVLPMDSTGNVAEPNVDTSQKDPYGLPYKYSRRVPLEQISRWKQQSQKVNQLREGEGMPSTSASEADNAHAQEWQKAKRAMSSKDPLAVKKVYAAKGFDVSELDSDTPPQ